MAILLIILTLLFPSLSWADPVHYAASCARTDVNSAISGAHNGDTVSIPSGSACNWAGVGGKLAISNKPLSIIGSGVGNTIIQNGGFTWYFMNNSGQIRISGIEFQCSNLAAVDLWSFPPYTITPIVDNNKFDAGSGVGCEANINGDISSSGGVITKNTFIAGSGSTIRHLRQPTDAGNYGFDSGYASWAADTNLGGVAGIVVAEGNTITWATPGSYSAFDGRSGSRIVMRYNNITNQMWGMHDQMEGHEYSTRQWEFYKNDIRYTVDTWLYPILVVGGTGVVWGNRTRAVDFTYGSDSPTLLLKVYRSWVSIAAPFYQCDNTTEKFCAGGVSGLACTADEDCTGSWHGANYTPPCAQVDGQSDSSGYPCRGALGRGKRNATTGMEAAEPAVFWDNLTCFAPGANCTPTEQGEIFIEAPNHTQSNRDYCTGATKPTECPTGTAWSYTPLSCPHPLAVSVVGLTGTCGDEAGVDGYNIEEEEGQGAIINPTIGPGSIQGLGIMVQ